MEHLYYDLHLHAGTAARVKLYKQANVMLLDSLNYQNYKSGTKFKYYGCLAKFSPTEIKPPYPGYRNLVIDLGGGSGTFNASISKIRS